MKEKKERKVSKVLNSLILTTFMLCIITVAACGLTAGNNMDKSGVYMAVAVLSLFLVMIMVLTIQRFQSIASNYERKVERADENIKSSKRQLAVLAEFLEFPDETLSSRMASQGEISKMDIYMELKGVGIGLKIAGLTDEEFAGMPSCIFEKAMLSKKFKLQETIAKEKINIKEEPKSYAFFRKILFIPTPALT